MIEARRPFLSIVGALKEELWTLFNEAALCQKEQKKHEMG